MDDGCFLKRREEMNEEEEKGAQKRGARRQSAFIFFESHRPVRFEDLEDGGICAGVGLWLEGGS
ncbi:unnamed protein product [Musa acuminata subsp. malaccensis]|uniref:(wild Malaysian banana) hypothetical protein n=1 Tax=Musa acuminata subsp. malaccensis TaxID=214687 RepID=A0A804HPB2_MUSAM|nr:unnamed protein product [Musa acuminata subsp. malaccensis]